MFFIPKGSAGGRLKRGARGAQPPLRRHLNFPTRPDRRNTAYNRTMIELSWAIVRSIPGFFAEIIASILANHYWEWLARRRAYEAARALAGNWIAYDINGRAIDDAPMKGAGLTVVSSKSHWWSKNSAVLDMHSDDFDSSTGRSKPHLGNIVIDPRMPWLATRVGFYTDSNEIFEQRLVIGPDPNLIYVFPTSAGAPRGDVYGQHVLRRKDGRM